MCCIMHSEPFLVANSPWSSALTVLPTSTSDRQNAREVQDRLYEEEMNAPSLETGWAVLVGYLVILSLWLRMETE